MVFRFSGASQDNFQELDSLTMRDRPRCWNSRYSCMPLQAVLSAFINLVAGLKHMSRCPGRATSSSKGYLDRKWCRSDARASSMPPALSTFGTAMRRTGPDPGVRPVTDAARAPFIFNNSPAVRLSNAAADACSRRILTWRAAHTCRVWSCHARYLATSMSCGTRVANQASLLAHMDGAEHRHRDGTLSCSGLFPLLLSFGCASLCLNGMTPVTALC